MLLGEDRAPRRDPPDQRQAGGLARRLLEPDAAGCARHQLDDALARQRPQVLLGGIRGTETERRGDFRPGRRHAGILDDLAYQVENLALARGELVSHEHDSVRMNSTCDYIQYLMCRWQARAGTLGTPSDNRLAGLARFR
jgi:hypothetical protein